VEETTDCVLDHTVLLIVLDLMDALQASFVGDELVYVVEHDRETAGVVESACSKSGASLKTRTLDINGLGHIKEAGLFANLTERGLSECLLDDDVEQGVHDGVVLHLGSGELLA